LTEFGDGETTNHDETVRIWNLNVDVERYIYGTVSLLAVLAVYEGWGTDQGTAGFLIVSVGTTFALFLAHLYGAATNEYFQMRRHLNMGEWAQLVAREVQYFLVLVPLTITFFIVRLTGGTVSEALRATSIVGISLVAALVTYAAWVVGVRGWRLVAAGVGGLIVGAVILAIELAVAH
jgi:hypothetical protein